MILLLSPCCFIGIMINFEDYYINCPSCLSTLAGKLIHAETVNQALLFSDGKTLNDNFMVIPQKMVRCPACGHLFWIEDLKPPIISKTTTNTNVYPWNTWRFYGCNFENLKGKLALIKHYQVFLSKRNYDPKKEIYLRRTLWWAYNDLHRYYYRTNISEYFSKKCSFVAWLKFRKTQKTGRKIFIDNQEGFNKNLNRLISLIEKFEPENSLELIELYRENGDFDKAKVILAKIPRRTHFISTLEKEVKKRNKNVFIVAG